MASERRVPIGELIASFGEPRSVASLIRHTTSQDEVAARSPDAHGRPGSR